MILLVQLCEMQRIQRSHSFWVPHRSNPSNQHSLPLSSLFLLRVPLLDRSQFRSALWKGRSWIIWWNDSMILWTTYFDCFPIFFDLHGVSLILYTWYLINFQGRYLFKMDMHCTVLNNVYLGRLPMNGVGDHKDKSGHFSLWGFLHLSSSSTLNNTLLQFFLLL